MNIVRYALLALLFIAAFGTASAAEPAELAATCLVKPAEAPKYPEREELKRTSAWLRFKLTFTQPDRAPKMELLTYNGSVGLLEAAQDYLKAYRLPCLPAGHDAVFEQVVDFEPTPEVAGHKASFLKDSAVNCLLTPEPMSVWQTQQTGRLVSQKQWGNLLVEMTFTAPDTPPAVKTLYASGNSAFLGAAREAISKYRLPCLRPEATPYTLQQQFSFRGAFQDKDYTLKNMGLMTFLRAAKDLDKLPVHFELDAMACPFKVSLKLYQPASPNQVDEVGPSVPSRAPFLDWLRLLALNIGPEQFEAVFGATSIITVPCGSIEL